MGCSCLGLLLCVLLFIVVALDDNKIVVLVRGDHHIVDFAGNTEEGQVILRVQITNEATSCDGQLRQPDGVLCGFFTFAHRRPDDLGLIALLHLGLLDNDEAFDTLVLLNAGNTIFNFGLQKYLKV